MIGYAVKCQQSVKMSVSDIALLATNVAAAILTFFAALAFVAKIYALSVVILAAVMCMQILAAIKTFMESSSVTRELKVISMELRMIREDMRGMHGQYHAANIASARPPDPSEVHRDVVAFPNETEAIVRDLLDDMVTAVVNGMPNVQQTPPLSERQTAENIQRHEIVCEADLDAREAELDAMREPKKTV